MRFFPGALAAGLLVAALPVTARTQPPIVDLQSLMTTPVWLLDGRRQVSQGTGFFFANMRADGTADAVFLVTNYHVVTGHAPRVSAPRSGDRIQLRCTRTSRSENTVVRVAAYNVRNGPSGRRASNFRTPTSCCAAAAAHRAAPCLEAHTRGDIKTAQPQARRSGPYGFFDRRHLLPIWKTGHVASEPDVDFEGEPTFWWMCPRSRNVGLTGLAVATGIYEGEDGIMHPGRVRKLLGIFSSMPVVNRPRRRRTRATLRRRSPPKCRQLVTSGKCGVIAGNRAELPAVASPPSKCDRIDVSVRTMDSRAVLLTSGPTSEPSPKGTLRLRLSDSHSMITPSTALRAGPSTEDASGPTRSYRQ